jgi:membrane-associated phospholipid phosphatase
MMVMTARGFDEHIAYWFHQRLTAGAADALYALSWPGSGLAIGLVLGAIVLGVMWRRRWDRLAWVVLTVPGGMLLGEAVKLLVHRHRPYVTGPFVDWAGYSFPSGHTIGATLLYGSLIVLALSVIERPRWRAATCLAGVTLIVAVAFSRVALGAHYLTDVLGAILLGTLWLTLCSLTLIWTRRRYADTRTA